MVADRTSFVRSLRNYATVAEKTLWAELKSSKLGFKFTRQLPIGRRVADFCCRQRNVVVEVDGASHASKLEDDEVRDQAMAEAGYLVVRVTNEEVLNQMAEVLDRIRTACEGRNQLRY